jgi:hypothetical protein
VLRRTIRFRTELLAELLILTRIILSSGCGVSKHGGSLAVFNNNQRKYGRYSSERGKDNNDGQPKGERLIWNQT